jgi:hypothetical protein
MADLTGRRTYPLSDPRPRAIAVYCSDPRFQKPIAEFIRTDLGLGDGEYIPLVVPGGVASLSEPLKLPKEFKFMKERLEFFLENFETARRIILINHEDCRHYQHFGSLVGKLFLHRVQSMGERQRNDLKAVARMVLGYAFPGLEVEVYYAAFSPGDPRSAVFEKVAL